MGSPIGCLGKATLETNFLTLIIKTISSIGKTI